MDVKDEEHQCLQVLEGKDSKETRLKHLQRQPHYTQTVLVGDTVRTT